MCVVSSHSLNISLVVSQKGRLTTTKDKWSTRMLLITLKRIKMTNSSHGTDIQKRTSQHWVPFCSDLKSLWEVLAMILMKAAVLTAQQWIFAGQSETVRLAQTHHNGLGHLQCTFHSACGLHFFPNLEKYAKQGELSNRTTRKINQRSDDLWLVLICCDLFQN